MIEYQQGFLFPSNSEEKEIIGYDAKNQALESGLAHLLLGLPYVGALKKQAFEDYLEGQELGKNLAFQESAIGMLLHTEDTANDCLDCYSGMQAVIEDAGISFQEQHMLLRGGAMPGKIFINCFSGNRTKFITAIHEYAHHLLGHVQMVNEPFYQSKKRYHELQVNVISYLVAYYFGIISFSSAMDLVESNVTSKEIEEDVSGLLCTARTIVDQLEEKEVVSRGIRPFVLPQTEKEHFYQPSLA